MRLFHATNLREYRPGVAFGLYRIIPEFWYACLNNCTAIKKSMASSGSIIISAALYQAFRGEANERP